MKILQVVTQMEAGGAQKVASLLHDGFRERGLQSELCFLYVKRRAYAEIDGVSSLLDHVPSKFEYLKILARLDTKLQSLKPDVLITHTHYANIMGQLAALLNRVPKRIAVHHNPLTSYPKAARILDWCFGQGGIYSKIVAVSDSVVETVAPYPSRYKRLVSRIYNGLPPAVDGVMTSHVRSELGIPPGCPLLVNVARLAKQKDHSTLLQTVACLPSAHLAVVGDGELRAQLKQQAIDLGIAGRVHFVGEVSRDEVFAYLRAADLFVFTSLFESMGLAVVEAMQVGIPVVVSDLPAMREVVGNAGQLIAPRDVSAFTSAVQSVLKNQALASRFGALGRSRARLFSADAMIDGYQQSLYI